jgi:hypothetical protein
MNTFLKRGFIFLMIAIFTLAFCYIVIPKNVFFYRPWEALAFSKKTDFSPFYPNSNLQMYSVGDLCHHTKNAIIKNEDWITDELGFRNNHLIKNADILFIGDSFIAGSGLTQDNTICNQITKRDQSLKVYNMAPSTFTEFDMLLKIGKINKPKEIIFSIVERCLPEKIQYFSSNKKSSILKNITHSISRNVYTVEVLKMYPLKWLKARCNKTIGMGIKSKKDSKMFFLNGNHQSHVEKDLSYTANTIIAYKKYCDSLNIKFIFLPMPDKETVYYELVPFQSQPKYLLTLISLLKNAGVNCINTIEIYNNYRKANSELLYHFDDTHWNQNGTALIANEIISRGK